MYIVADYIAPNGAPTSIHTFVLDTYEGESTVIVNSFFDLDIKISAWQYHIGVNLAGEVNDQTVANWLVSSDGLFSGGQVRSDTWEDVERRRLLNLVEKYRDAFIHQGCATPYGVIDTDEASIRNITAAYQTAIVSKMNDADFSIDWRLANNDMATMNREEMIDIGNRLNARIKHCYERSWELKREIETADEVGLRHMLIGAGWEADQ